MSLAPIVIDLLVKNVPQVQNSFKGVQDAAIRAERAIQREQERAEKARVASAQREARAKEKAFAGVAREAEKWQKQEIRNQERTAKEQERIIDRAARDKVRIHSQAVREVERIEERARANSRRAIEQETRDKERAAAQWVRMREREEKAAQQSRARFATGLVGAAGRGVVSGMQRVGNVTMGLATTAAQLGGGFAVADSLERQLGAQRTSANIAASTMGQSVTAKEILASARSTGIRYGIESEDVLQGIGKFKDLTGDTKRGMALVPEIAKLATAFGGDIGELAENAGNIAMSSPDMKNEDVMRLLRVQTAQGAVGAVELKDLAKYGGRLTAGASLFGGDRATNIATMGAFAQIARQHGGASSPAEATLAAQRFATDIQKHSKDLEAQGIKVSDGKGGMRDARDIVKDMVTKSGGDVTKLTKFGLGERGVRVLTGFSDISRQAGGGAKGMEAINQELAKYTQGVSDEEVEKRAKGRLAEDDKKLETAMQQLRNAVGEQLLPEFIKMIPALRDLVPPLIEAARIGIPAFAELLRNVADFANAHKDIIRDIAAHPIGSLIALELTKSFASAALPGLLKSLISGIFSGSAGGGGGGLGKGGAGVGGALTAGVAAGAATYALVKPGVDAGLAGQTSGQFKTGEYLQTLKHGSPEAKSRALAEIQSLQANYGGVRGVLDGLQAASASVYTTAYSKITGEKNIGTEAIEKTVAAREILGNEELKRAIAQAAAEGIREGVSKGLSNSGPNGAGRSEPIINR